MLHNKQRYNLGNKKAQVGETLTWIPATLIIIAILIIFILVSSVLGEKKDFTENIGAVFIGSYVKTSDWIGEKNSFALDILDISDENGRIIDDWIDKNEG